MTYKHLLADTWAPTPALLHQQTFFLSELAFGHLIHYFSTPASFTTWDEDIPRRIQDLLQRVAAHGHHKVKPTCAVRSMLLVLSIKKDIPKAVAFNDDIELLFMLAFKSLAAAYDPAFTESIFDTLTDGRYVGTKMEHYPHYLHGHLVRALEEQQMKKVDANIAEVLKFYLSPFIPKKVEGGIPDESPTMPSYCELVRREPARCEQTLAFPDSLRKMSPLSPVMEEQMSFTDTFHTMENVEVQRVLETATDAAGSSTLSMPTFPSFETETDLSSVSNPFDEQSRSASIPSFPSSLTSMDSSASMGQVDGSKFREDLPVQSAALPSSCERRVHFDVKPDADSSSYSPSSSSTSMHNIRHNPATQLNAVLAGQPAKASSTRYSAPAYESDLFPDLFPDPYSMSPSRPQHNSCGSRPETYVHTIDTFPMRQVRQWQANRRGKKAFAQSASSKTRSSDSSKSKLLLRLKLSRPRVIDRHDDSSSMLLARQEGGQDAQTSTAHGNWRGPSSSPQPWKRLLVVPVAYVRLRIGEIRYGCE